VNFKTGSKNLDRLIQGGYPGGAITTIMGEVGTGRTTLALSASIVAARQRRKILYLDCEGGITRDTTFNLGLGQDLFHLLNPTSVEDCLKTALSGVSTTDANLIVLDSPNILGSSRGSVASVSGMLTNWMPKALRALEDRPDTMILIGWQLRRAVTKKSANFGEPLALGHGASVSLLLERLEEDGISVKVTKDVRDIVHAEPPSCIIRFTGKGLFEDIRVSSEPIDRNRIPSRFDRDDVI